MDFSKLYEYEDIVFENKYVKIINEKKEIIFEDNIEFPKDFDDNAAATVASRYLCNNSKNKETSIKQMFNRVSDTITTWGFYNNYFKPAEDLKEADEFNSKLRYYQIHKYFAFNSPVYFNVGLQEVPQTSACFILGVEDDMTSITDLSKLEAKIFKKGSGAGSNLSEIRSSKETVSGGGKASGPVSFLKSHDVLAGVIKSGGTLRRSAKLACLNIDHPDIEEFIDCKLFEEEKLSILRKSGLSARDGYDLSDEVFFQNTNLSVRVTDEFMKRVEKNSIWDTKFIKSGKVYKTYDAKYLLKKIAETSWKIADPGLQFHDTTNKWNTLANDGEIVASNPCAEFVSLNNTSCNLASINLIKFFSRDKNNKIIFDYKTFEDVIRTVIIAQDILIDNSSYPNDKITINSKKYRNLGLGYTNLGGSLMWLGIPYDSDEGRSLAASLTAAMTAVAYETSADLADKIEEFEGFEKNKTSLLKVLHQHYEALNNYSTITELDTEIKTFASNFWKRVIKRKHFRNAQVSLLAPTGTISFIMNSITTGIEPEFSLVRYKRLAGSDGSTIKIINPIVEETLRYLKYSEIEIPLLIKELLGEGDLKIPSRFKNDDKKIFLTAAPIPGTNLCINYMGHIKMCAAVQPFLSGSVSKTINLSKDVTVDEIYNLYIQAWKMGLKGITIYRDGSKNFQPLTTDEKKSLIESGRAVKLVRKKLPDERPAITHKFRIGGSDGYITCGLYPDTGTLGEIFVNVSKEGSALSGFADALATVLSIAIQYGVPIKEYVRKLSHLKFEPNGFTSNPDIRIANSMVDYIARYIGLKFLSKEDQIELGLISSNKDKNNILLEKQNTSSIHDQDIGPACPNCGSIMRRLGSCYFCNNCSYNTGSCG
jgi:ribonucleoside-diphosphate reductase alpha chain